MARNTISEHLGILVQADLLLVRQEGTRRLFAVNDAAAKSILADLDNLIAERTNDFF